MSVMAQFRQQLANLTNSGGSHRDLADKYRAILENILTFGEDELVEGLKSFIEAIVNENVSLVISRQLLSEVGSTLVRLQVKTSEIFILDCFNDF